MSRPPTFQFHFLLRQSSEIVRDQYSRIVHALPLSSAVIIICLSFASSIEEGERRFFIARSLNIEAHNVMTGLSGYWCREGGRSESRSDGRIVVGRIY